MHASHVHPRQVMKGGIISVNILKKSSFVIQSLSLTLTLYLDMLLLSGSWEQVAFWDKT